MAVPVIQFSCLHILVALDDISATEWRSLLKHNTRLLQRVALDDISATEWRPHCLR